MATIPNNSLGRRDFLMAVAVGLSVSPWRSTNASPSAELDGYLLDRMAAHHVPGLAVAVLQNTEVLWSKGYGYADLASQRPMSADTLLNIGSISKTFTATAVMQLWERGWFQLDDDINDYLSFRVRNPLYPDAPISIRHLLTHTSSLTDGAAYVSAYTCAKPDESLQQWLSGFLVEGGRHYDRERNFHTWAPGERFAYANIAFGLLARLVENVSGQSFEAYCQANIFGPLGMTQSSWYLDGLDRSLHATPYTWMEAGVARGPSWGGVPIGVVGNPEAEQQLASGYVENCLYSHPNHADGFLRSSVNQLALYAAVYLRQGRYASGYLLKPETIKMMFTPQASSEKRVMGLTWNARRRTEGALRWGHGGSDPGINSYLLFRFEDGTAAIVLMNTNDMDASGGPMPVQFAEYLVDRTSENHTGN